MSEACTGCGGAATGLDPLRRPWCPPCWEDANARAHRWIHGRNPEEGVRVAMVTKSEQTSKSEPMHGHRSAPQVNDVFELHRQTQKTRWHAEYHERKPFNRVPNQFKREQQKP